MQRLASTPDDEVGAQQDFGEPSRCVRGEIGANEIGELLSPCQPNGMLTSAPGCFQGQGHAEMGWNGLANPSRQPSTDSIMP